jgi:hypothetical protein
MNDKLEWIWKEAVATRLMYFPGGWGIPRKPSVRIIGTPTEIRTEYLKNTGLERHL